MTEGITSRSLSSLQAVRGGVAVQSTSKRAEARTTSEERTSRDAFTLTDLLFAVAAVMVVAAIVSGPLASSRRKARLAQCTANLKTVSHAVLQFAEEHNKTLPAAVPDEPGDLWWWYKEQVKQYAGLNGESSTNDLVFGCPEDRGYSDPRPFRVSPRFDFSSYVYNGVILPGMPNVAGREVASVKQPARTLLVMEWTAHAPLSWHRSRTGKANQPFYSDAESVAAFVDGHVNLTKIYYDGYDAAYTRDPISSYDYQFSGN